MNDKNMPNKFISCIALFVLFILLIPSYAFSSTETITIGTCGTGGYWYQSGTVLAQLINESTERIQAKAIPTACTAANISQLHKGEQQIGMSVNYMDIKAWHGIDPFEFKANINSLSFWYNNYVHVFTLDDDIKTIEDLEGKRVVVGVYGGGTRQIAIPMLEIAGLEPGENVEVINQNLERGIDMLRAGQADAQFWLMPTKNPAMTSLTESRDVKFISVDEKYVRELPELLESAFYLSDIPADTYKGQEKDATFLTCSVTLLTHANMDDETIYKVTKALWENIDQYHKALPETAKDLKKETALKGLVIPLHPGAKEYYKEHNFPGIADVEEAVDVTKSLEY